MMKALMDESRVPGVCQDYKRYADVKRPGAMFVGAMRVSALRVSALQPAGNGDLGERQIIGGA